MAQVALTPPPALYSGLLQGSMLQLEASSHPGRPWRAPQVVAKEVSLTGSLLYSVGSNYTLPFSVPFPGILKGSKMPGLYNSEQYGQVPGPNWLQEQARPHPGSPLPPPRLDLPSLWVHRPG